MRRGPPPHPRETAAASRLVYSAHRAADDLYWNILLIFGAIVLSKTSQVASIRNFAAIEVIEAVMFFGFGGWGLASGIASI